MILAKVNKNSTRQFNDLSDVLMRLDTDLCRTLLNEILPKLSILDPACGSGAFLVAAMKNLLNIYGVVYGKIDVLNDTYLSKRLADIRRQHPSINYYMRKQIIVDNLFGVDIMDEATEIAKLRLFLALVSSAQKLEDLEPLPNIDFNIMAGNSLIGLLSVDEVRFDEGIQMEDMMQRFKARDYQRALKEKNRLIALYQLAHAFYAIKENRIVLDIVLVVGGYDRHDRCKVFAQMADAIAQVAAQQYQTIDCERFQQMLGFRGAVDLVKDLDVSDLIATPLQHPVGAFQHHVIERVSEFVYAR